MAGPPGSRRGRRVGDAQTPPARASAWSAALALLALRARTAREIRDGLRRRGYPPEEISETVARLAASRYLDDAEFARNWAAARARRNGMGPNRLTRELRARGVAEADIAAAMAALADEWDPAAAADAAARRKARALAGLSPEIARRRLAGHLERRGFPPEIIVAMCRRHLPGGDAPED
jgi:regulatory protein